MGDWLAGAAELDITPPLGVSMTGYAGRPGPADHILDPLSVRALALQAEDGEPLVLTCGDLLGLSDATVRQIRNEAAPWVRPERLLLNHSHTHAGPTTAPLRCMREPDAAYGGMVVRWTVSAVREALRRLRPARLLFGTAPTAIGMNRRERREERTVLGFNPAGAYDPTVSVLRVEEETGRPLACWFSHATHPVVMGNQNTGISAEWPGAAAAALSQLLECPAVFAQGCCGDVNPVRRGDHAVARSVGRELAGAALAAWERAEPLASRGLAAALETVSLPQQKPSVHEAEAALEEARERLRAVEAECAGSEEAERGRKLEIPREMLAWAEDYLAAARADGCPAVRMDVQALRIGDLALVATGAETFIEIGQEIQRRSPFPRVVALGYSNGCFGYLPTAKAFPLGGYEVDAAFKYYGTLMVTPDCERLTLEAAERVLGRLDSGG
jgi:hypothetical protein